MQLQEIGSEHREALRIKYSDLKDDGEESGFRNVLLPSTWIQTEQLLKSNLASSQVSLHPSWLLMDVERLLSSKSDDRDRSVSNLDFHYNVQSIRQVMSQISLLQIENFDHH